MEVAQIGERAGLLKGVAEFSARHHESGIESTGWDDGWVGGHGVESAADFPDHRVSLLDLQLGRIECEIADGNLVDSPLSGPAAGLGAVDASQGW